MAAAVYVHVTGFAVSSHVPRHYNTFVDFVQPTVHDTVGAYLAAVEPLYTLPFEQEVHTLAAVQVAQFEGQATQALFAK